MAERAELWQMLPMISRRFVLGGGLAAARVVRAPSAWAAAGDFASFLATFRASARAAGISGATLDRALAGLAPFRRFTAPRPGALEQAEIRDAGAFARDVVEA